MRVAKVALALYLNQLLDKPESPGNWAPQTSHSRCLTTIVHTLEPWMKHHLATKVPIYNCLLV